MKASIIFSKHCGNAKAYRLIHRLKALGYSIQLYLLSTMRVTRVYAKDIPIDKVDSINSHYGNEVIALDVLSPTMSEVR
jgi:hypothetical protein